MRDTRLSDQVQPVTGVPTAHQHVREIIRKHILSGALPAGSKLRQADLARLTGASTTPVREALRELATEGLVTFDAHRGAEVRSIDPEEMLEIYDLRGLIEPYAVARAAHRITPDELQRAADMIAAMSSLEDPAEWAVLNRDFHALIVDAGGSSRASAIVKALRDSAFLFVGTGARQDHSRMRIGDRDHAAILDALAKGDAELAGELTRKHLEGSIRVSGIDTARDELFRGER